MTARYSIIDAATLPPLTLVDIPDKETMIRERMEEVKARWVEHDPPLGAAYDVEGTEFDPIKIVEEAGASFELNALSFVNAMGRATTLATAWGDNLDAIGSRYPGGVPRLPGESDERYRRRLFLSANSYTTAGSGPAYEFQALTAVPELRDVSAVVLRPSLKEDPIVTITCLAADPANPEPTIQQLLAVQARVSDPEIAPLTDVVAVRAPDVVPLAYVIQLWLYPNADDVSVLAQANVALQKLIEDQRWLGSDHNRMSIAAACNILGVQNAIVVSPAADVKISDQQVGHVTSLSVTVAGRAT